LKGKAFVEGQIQFVIIVSKIAGMAEKSIFAIKKPILLSRNQKIHNMMFLNFFKNKKRLTLKNHFVIFGAT
jgi:hypothetical protein